MYGCTLTFFEQVENENICAAMFTLSNMYDTQQSSPIRLEDAAGCRQTGYGSGTESDGKAGGDSTRYIHFSVRLLLT